MNRDHQKAELLEAQARVEIASGSFPTKAAQSRVRGLVSTALELMIGVVRSVHLSIAIDARTDAQTALYFALPMYPHEWRAKHADGIRTHLPDAAVHIAFIERLVALATEIKAMPIVLVPSCRTLSRRDLGRALPIKKCTIVCDGRRMTVTTPEGEIARRSTTRTYHAAILGRREDGTLRIESAGFDPKRVMGEAQELRYSTCEFVALSV